MNPIVLIVDDEPDILDAARFFFEIEDCKVLIATGGRVAKEIIEREPIDVLLTDMKMPDGSGRDLLTWICTRNDRPSIYTMTGFGALSTEEIIQFGVIDCYSKPLNFEKAAGEILSNFRKTRGSLVSA